MAGKTLINGTAYTIKGGKTRINGTAYSIKQGKTLVNGTAYTISLGGNVSLSFSGDFDVNYSYATWNGNAVKTAMSTANASTDGTLSVYVSSSSTSYRASCRVYLNGAAVKSGYGTYTINMSQYKTSIAIKFVKKTAGSYVYYNCEITAT